MHRGARLVGRQFQDGRRSRQFFFPVGLLPLVGLTLQPVALPGREIRILDRQFWQRRRTPLRKGPIELRDFVVHHFHGPLIRDDVVNGDQQFVFQAAEMDQGRAKERNFGEIEGFAPLFANHAFPFAFAILAGVSTEIYFLNLTLRQEIVEGLYLENLPSGGRGPPEASIGGLTSPCAPGHRRSWRAATRSTGPGGRPDDRHLPQGPHAHRRGQDARRPGRRSVGRGAQRQPRLRAASSWPASRPARPAGSTAAPSTSRSCEPQPGDADPRPFSFATERDRPAADRSATSPTPTRRSTT